MKRIHIITVAYCRSAQLARALLELKNDSPFCDTFTIVQGHYPIDRERNNKEIELIAQSFYADLIDPGGNLGSAQSQQYALNHLNVNDESYWVNYDPDSACRDRGWADAMEVVLDNDPNCMFISCMSPMVKSFLDNRNQLLVEKDVSGVRIGVPQQPTPFNLSMFRCSFVKAMGGLHQGGIWWGELEAICYHHATIRGKYHAYLLDYMENEDGKFFHPTSNAEWKDRHCRTVGEHQFAGNYEDFLKYYYPHLADLKL